MKKFLMMVVLLFGVMFGSYAQTNNESFPRYGFWSNWSIGASGIFTKDIDNNWVIGQGSNIGFDVRFAKQLNYHWYLRLIGDVPALFTSDTLNMDRYAKTMVGFTWMPFKHFYLFVDGGLGYLKDQFNYVALANDFGVGLNFNVCERSHIFGELGMDCVADYRNDFYHNNLYAKVGYAYSFGLTKIDQEIEKTRKSLILIDETYPLLCDSLRKENKKLTDNEVYLMDKISILEMHDSSLHIELANKCAIIDSLNNIIDDISTNKLNYYALPFSVLFDFDSYSIKSSENSKVKAIANIMKQDTNVNYTLVGFCDNSGSQEYNLKLSKKRVEAVKNALIKYGVKEDQISVDYKGKDAPFGNGDLNVNRRVSFYRNF